MSNAGCVRRRSTPPSVNDVLRCEGDRGADFVDDGARRIGPSSDVLGASQPVLPSTNTGTSKVGMSHIVLIHLVFFLPAVSGASAFAWIVLSMLQSTTPPSGKSGGTRRRIDPRPAPHAGPEDLARSV